MQKKLSLTFIVISMVLMFGYIFCIAAPPPNQWGVWLSNSIPGYINNDPDYGGQIWCNTYVACNKIQSGGAWNFRTYHWAYGFKSGGGTIKFKREFKLDENNKTFGTVIATNTYEQEEYKYKIPGNGTYHPYTAMYQMVGEGQVKAQLNNVNVP